MTIDNKNLLENIGKGWHKFIQPLIDKCENENVEILQVKEKFGSLRFYIAGNATVELIEMIENAQNLSTSTCELCGNLGRINCFGKYNILKCLCDNCDFGKFQ